ncbi:uncharacterized protein LOC101965466 isoform X7 [Ictidomys tridecemlineatus]
MPRDGGPCPSASQQGDESLTQVLQEVPLYTWWPGGEMAAFSLQGANAWPRIGSKAGAHCPQWAVSQRVPEAALSCPSMATLLADLGESVFQHPWPSRICLEEIKINAILYNSTLVPSDPYTRDLFNYLTAATKPEVLCPPQPPPPRDWIAEAGKPPSPPCAGSDFPSLRPGHVLFGSDGPWQRVVFPALWCWMRGL